MKHSWFARNWRKLVVLALTAAGSIAADRTVVRTYAPVAVEVVNALPCTPGEAGCPQEK